MKVDFRKLKDSLDLTAFLVIMSGIIAGIEWYPIFIAWSIWFLSRTAVDVIEEKFPNEI